MSGGRIRPESLDGLRRNRWTDSVGICSYEAAWATEPSNAYRDFEAVSIRTEVTDSGAYRISGEIRNNSGEDVEHLVVQAALFGSDGHILSVGLGELGSTSLAPGETTTFEVLMSGRAEGEIGNSVVFIEGLLRR
jgi:hypothetical protein